MDNIIKNFNSGEYEGTIIIDRSGIVECNNSTFWANGKSVMIIKASGVTIRNARIEAGSKGGFAIETDSPDLILDNVEIKGNIKGLPSESENWNLPSVINLGDFPSDCENVFFIEITSPVNANIINDIYGLEISPAQLQKGKNNIKITVQPMKNNTIIYGEIFIKSTVKRRIYINGKSSDNANQIKQNTSAPDIPYLLKGQRINFDQYCKNNMKFVLEKRSSRKNMDLDGYAFMLGENQKTFCDEDLIFFGNPVSKDNSVKITGDSNTPSIEVNLTNLNNKYKRISICFAIYGNDNSLNFSLVDSPVMRIFSDQKEIYRFRLENLNVEKTVVSAELYLYKNTWKLNCIGSGYKDGLKKLCESYGVEVND